MIESAGDTDVLGQNSAPQHKQLHGWAAMLEPGEVAVWQLDLRRVSPEPCPLNADERARAQRFRRPEDAARYRSGRAQLRQILGAALSVSPSTLPLSVAEGGKPHFATHDLAFNISRSGQLAVLAVAMSGDVGIDLERADRVDEIDAIAKTMFHADEAAALAAITDPDQRLDLFLRIWTAKEAVLKATGEGLTADTAAFSVLTAEQGHHQFDPTRLGACGTLTTINVGPSFVATLAWTERLARVKYFGYWEGGA